MEYAKILKLKEEILKVDDIGQIEEVHKAATARWRELSREKSFDARGSIEVGDVVQWESHKRDRGRMSGKVVKKNATRAQVRVVSPGGTTVIWNVPFSMLAKVQG